MDKFTNLDRLQTTKETLAILMGGHRLLLVAEIQENELTVDIKSKLCNGPLNLDS